ncbi:hypothetical protein [Paenibacillus alkalitolerans]|uniref:hypothetical protein n=1 Tax=Paenibacillus alkalitolerans TaxID=2799335 RepID=UPI0018F456D4|nr:hypothetical protein [Paenibacillus alkalitolerans]
MQIIRDINGWIAKVDSGDLYKFDRLNAEIVTVRKVIFPANVQPEIVKMYGYPFFAVLTGMERFITRNWKQKMRL